MKRMKAVQIVEPGRPEMVETPVPEPGPGQVLSRVLAVTTCPQWDLHLAAGDPMFPGAPLSYPYTIGQPGHEMVGEIMALGEGVFQFAAGDRVCAWRDQGHHRQGCYAEYVVHDAENLILAPTRAEPPALAPLELAMCVSASFTLLDRFGAITGKRFGVTGLGPAGLIAIQLARALGAKEVIGFDLLPRRRRVALDVGADQVLDPREAETPPRPSSGCLDAGIDCVGSRSSVEFLLAHTKEFAALFGVQREEYAYTCQAGAGPGLVLLGYPGHSREAAEFAAQQLKSGRLDLSVLVTHRLPLEEYATGVDLLRRQEAIKVCFLP